MREIREDTLFSQIAGLTDEAKFQLLFVDSNCQVKMSERRLRHDQLKFKALKHLGALGFLRLAPLPLGQIHVHSQTDKNEQWFEARLTLRGIAAVNRYREFLYETSQMEV